MSKTTKASEIRKYALDKIEAEVKAAQRSLFDLRSQAVTEKIADTSQFKKLRKEIARLRTEARARTLTTASAATAGRKNAP
ncbi:MAG: 50S ribosomal protein L29 [Phycisphaerae bacterium]|nr:50S ribosomal protein L29 [Phycisphaerae bacterium]